MAIYKSAMGKVIDMGSLSAKNEKVRAVGNAKMNARGDIVDTQGRVVKPAPNRANEIYSKAVGTKGAQPMPVAKKRNEELSKHEQELDDLMNDDIQIEKIKAKEIKERNKK
jgi:hypothetical protein